VTACRSRPPNTGDSVAKSRVKTVGEAAAALAIMVNLHRSRRFMSVALRDS